MTSKSVKSVWDSHIKWAKVQEESFRLGDKNAFPLASVAIDVLNIIEDARIERAWAAEYPGTAARISYMNHYYFKQIKATGNKICDTINALIYLTKVGEIPHTIKDKEVINAVSGCIPYLESGRKAVSTEEAREYSIETLKEIKSFITANLSEKYSQQAPDQQGIVKPEKAPSVEKEPLLRKKPGNKPKKEPENKPEEKSEENNEEGPTPKEPENESNNETEDQPFESLEEETPKEPESEKEPKPEEELEKKPEAQPHDVEEELEGDDENNESDIDSADADDFHNNEEDDDEVPETEGEVEEPEFEDTHNSQTEQPENDMEYNDEELTDQTENLESSSGLDDEDQQSEALNDDSRNGEPGGSEFDFQDEEDEFDQETYEEMKQDIFQEALDSARAELEKIEQEEVSARLRAQREEEKNSIKGLHDNVSLEIFKPSYNPSFYKTLTELYKKEITELTKEIRQALVYRKSQPERGRRKGNIDSGRLWKVALDETEVFYHRNRDGKKSEVVFYLLIDSSGSMSGGNKAERCIAATIICANALQKNCVPFCCTGFTTVYRTNDRVLHVNYVDFPGNGSLEPLAGYMPIEENRDGYSIRIATQEILKRPERKKVLIVLSDGLPSHIDSTIEYSSKIAVNDTLLAVREAERQMVNVIGIYFGDADKLDTYKKMYPRFVYVPPERLPGTLGSLIRRVLKNI